MSLVLAVIAAACRQSPTAAPDTPAPATQANPPTEAQQPTQADQPTQAEQPSETAAPTQDTSLLYQDDFSDLNSGWPVVQPEFGLGSYQDPNVYRLESRAPNLVVHVTHPGAFSDYHLEAKMFVNTAGPGQWQHGVVFRQVTPDNYYAFLINPRAQTWQVAKQFLGEWQVLAEGPSNAISLDPATPTTLAVFAQGGGMTFAINGTGVVQVVDTTFAAGEIGFMLLTLDEPSVQVSYDEITVRRYDAAQVPPAPTASPVSTATPTPTITGTPPTATSEAVLTPLTTRSVPPVPPTVDPRTAVAGTLSAVQATANAVATQAASLCGLPLLPPCP